MQRDFVWECNYGERKHLVPIIGELLNTQDAASLQMVSYHVNNVPYNLEFYIVLSYNEPLETHIDKMFMMLSEAGIKYRPDITFDRLSSEMANRRFSSMTFIDEEQYRFAHDALFEFAEISYIKKAGYRCFHPIEEKTLVFISHQSIDKPEIEELIPYLNGANLPVWFDKISIDYGQSITKEIQRGIRKSSIAIFWITNNFLKSNWCDTELQNFLSKFASKKYGEILLLPIVDQDVDIDRYEEIFLTNIKYLTRQKNHTIEAVAKEIIPSIKSFLNNQ